MPSLFNLIGNKLAELKYDASIGEHDVELTLSSLICATMRSS